MDMASRENAGLVEKNNKIMKIQMWDEPYIFISYSHRDITYMHEVKEMLEKYGLRYWYDDGLHSGADWNLMIATYLAKATVCLLLLSENSAESQYVKNELNFAVNHRVPIHILRISDFKLPIDIEIMLGRIQMINMSDEYEYKLLQAFPPELQKSASTELGGESDKKKEHPLFQIQAEIMNRQGTISYLGKHKGLEYDILIQQESIFQNGIDKVREQSQLVAKLSHPLFPRIIDSEIVGNTVWTYQEYRGEVFLDTFLQENKMTEERIIEWIAMMIDAMEYLFALNLGLKDFPRGSMVVTKQGKIGMFRLQNLYYGVFKLQPETKQYYFEKEVQEIAVLLYQLCTGEYPVLPFKILRNKSYSRAFIEKVNLIIQKSAKEHGKIRYNNFREIKEDLYSERIYPKDFRFLVKRSTVLKKYEKEKSHQLCLFVDEERKGEITRRKDNLEEKFGLEGTVVLQDCVENEKVLISILVCSTGQLLEFSKDEIIIGRYSQCDMILNQPSISRMHAKIKKHSDGEYWVEDMNASNGTYIVKTGKRIQAGQEVMVLKDEIISVGGVELKLL